MSNELIDAPPTRSPLVGDNKKPTSVWGRWFQRLQALILPQQYLLRNVPWKAHHLRFLGNGAANPTEINWQWNYTSVVHAATGKYTILFDEPTLFDAFVLYNSHLSVHIRAVNQATPVLYHGQIDYTIIGNLNYYRLNVYDAAGTLTNLPAGYQADIMFFYSTGGYNGPYPINSPTS